MDVRWQLRPFEGPIYIQNLPNSAPKERMLEVGDVVVLYPLEDKDKKDELRITVLSILSNGKMKGEVAATNRRGAAGNLGFKKGAPVEFHRSHVFRFNKAT